jgi:hypothetical protein
MYLIMKKVIIVLASAAILTSCGNSELENVWSEYQEVSVEKEKKDPNFLIFKDRTQTGKEESK